MNRVNDDEARLNAQCKHPEFDASVGVARMEDTGEFNAEITIKCRACGMPFQWLGLEPGIDTQGARVSVDGIEARIAICPFGSRPNPMQRMMFNIAKFDG